jgi:hypothetical protein
LKTASPNPAANPSYYFASQILSGRDGLERGAERRIRSRGPSIPAQEPDRAIERLEEDGFYKKAIGPTSWRASRRVEPVPDNRVGVGAAGVFLASAYFRMLPLVR